MIAKDRRVLVQAAQMIDHEADLLAESHTVRLKSSAPTGR